MKIPCEIKEISFTPGIDCTHMQSGNYAQKMADELGQNKIIGCWAEGEIIKCDVLVRTA